MHLRTIALIPALALAISGCNKAYEPSEAQMEDAMRDALNHPESTVNADPIRITSFKKEACDKPTPQGYRCSFTMTVESANPLAKTLNDLSTADFSKDKDSGKWVMQFPL